MAPNTQTRREVSLESNHFCQVSLNYGYGAISYLEASWANQDFRIQAPGSVPKCGLSLVRITPLDKGGTLGPGHDRSGCRELQT